MSKRASCRTQQIAEEIAALKSKLSLLRDDVTGNRLGSRHSSWYHQRYLTSPQSKTSSPEDAEPLVAGSQGGSGSAGGREPRMLSFAERAD
jgi:hypothetical protein